MYILKKKLLSKFVVAVAAVNLVGCFGIANNTNDTEGDSNTTFNSLLEGNGDSFSSPTTITSSVSFGSNASSINSNAGSDDIFVRSNGIEEAHTKLSSDAYNLTNSLSHSSAQILYGSNNEHNRDEALNNSALAAVTNSQQMNTDENGNGANNVYKNVLKISSEALSNAIKTRESMGDFVARYIADQGVNSNDKIDIEFNGKISNNLISKLEDIINCLMLRCLKKVSIILDNEDDIAGYNRLKNNFAKENPFIDFEYSIKAPLQYSPSVLEESEQQIAKPLISNAIASTIAQNNRDNNSSTSFMDSNNFEEDSVAPRFSDTLPSYKDVESKIVLHITSEVMKIIYSLDNNNVNVATLTDILLSANSQITNLKDVKHLNITAAIKDNDIPEEFRGEFIFGLLHFLDKELSLINDNLIVHHSLVSSSGVNCMIFGEERKNVSFKYYYDPATISD